MKEKYSLKLFFMFYNIKSEKLTVLYTYNRAVIS